MTAENTPTDNNNMDVEGLLEERARLDKIFHEQFRKVITVMFTDLKGSTAIADTQGDMASRAMIKYHNDILFPIIEKHNGILVKTMGDGTMSYFESAQDAVRAGAEMQAGIDEFNMNKTLDQPIFIRVGIHTGKGIVEENDIFGDVVNVASRFESSANAGEIYLSEETYNSLTDKSEIYCRFIKTTTLKGKKDPFKIYKAFWNPSEIEKDIKGTESPKKDVKSGMSLPVKAVLMLIPVVLILFILFNTTNLFNAQSPDEKRSKKHSVSIPATPNR